MKKLVTLFALFCAIALSIPGSSLAQHLGLNSVSASSFCSGDPITVDFTIDGAWGPKNAFTLLLSGPDGSFTSASKNLGTIQDVSMGTLSIVSTIPVTITSSSHYRVKIQGAGAFTDAVTNTSDLFIGQSVSPLLVIAAPTSAVIGTAVSFSVAINGFDGKDDSMYWDFGDSATPPTVACINSENIAPSVTYASEGARTVKLHIVVPGGCSKDTTFPITVYGYKAMPIRKNAQVIANDTTANFTRKALWVNPGVKLTVSNANGFDTIFAEQNAQITASGKHIVYLKKGASLIGTGGATVIYETGATVDASKNVTLLDNSLVYDYTNAPTNPGMNQGVHEDAALLPVTVSPNPTVGAITLMSMPQNVREVTIMNTLGETMMTVAPHGSDLTINLARFSAGTYYVRIASNNGITTKRIVKE